MNSKVIWELVRKWNAAKDEKTRDALDRQIRMVITDIERSGRGKAIIDNLRRGKTVKVVHGVSESRSLARFLKAKTKNPK